MNLLAQSYAVNELLDKELPANTTLSHTASTQNLITLVVPNHFRAPAGEPTKA